MLPENRERYGLRDVILPELDGDGNRCAVAWANRPQTAAWM